MGMTQPKGCHQPSQAKYTVWRKSKQRKGQ